jgi:hypothetical protein
MLREKILLINLNGNDFDEDLFIDLLLDQMKAKIEKKKLAPK